jgi:hypothetical protein
VRSLCWFTGVCRTTLNLRFHFDTTAQLDFGKRSVGKRRS